MVNRPGAWAWAAVATTRASWRSPCAAATLARVITKAAAPSEMDEALAAVIVPSLAKAGLSEGIFSGFALLGCSSVSTTVAPPRPATVTGSISRAKAPPAIAAFARSSERIA